MALRTASGRGILAPFQIPGTAAGATLIGRRRRYFLILRLRATFFTAFTTATRFRFSGCDDAMSQCHWKGMSTVPAGAITGQGHIPFTTSSGDGGLAVGRIDDLGDAIGRGGGRELVQVGLHRGLHGGGLGQGGAGLGAEAVVAVLGHGDGGEDTDDGDDDQQLDQREAAGAGSGDAGWGPWCHARLAAGA
ncbi:hypothetical protein Q671_12010 [Halomonas sp. PBN3]|nr:hypothetical protein Q671_12010 [Halomonas sp. PBN3]